jgi:hypothetical protein
MDELADLALQVALTINAVRPTKWDDPEVTDAIMGHLQSEASDMRETLTNYVTRLREGTRP